MRYAFATLTLLGALVASVLYLEEAKPAWYAKLRYPLEYERPGPEIQVYRLRDC